MGLERRLCLPSGSRLVGRDGVHSGDFHLLGVSGNRLKIVVVNHDGGHAFVCWLEEVPYTVCRPSLEACPRPHVKCNKLDHGISREREALEESDLFGSM